MTASTPPLSLDQTLALEERQWVSRFSMPTLGVVLYAGSTPTDPDNLTVSVSCLDGDGTVVSTRTADRDDVGVYSLTLGTADTATTGLYDLRWSYLRTGTAQTMDTFFEVGASAPAYDVLPPEMQAVVESVWVRFADLTDSPLGGPHLSTYVQANFSRQRFAQMLVRSIARLSAMVQPHANYSVDGVAFPQFPLGQWGGLLDQALYVEVLKHLRRSYVEQPSPQGVTVSYMDRRDYMDRWGEVLRDESEDLQHMTDVFKIANMGLGNVHALVGGGAFGMYGQERIGGYNGTRPRFWALFY